MLEQEDGSVGQPEGQEAGGRWMTKAELARVRPIALGSADRLIRRQGWRRQPGNDGRVRVLVPDDWLQIDPNDRPTNDPRAKPTDGLMPQALAALEDAHATLREQLTAANLRAERAETSNAAERARADALRGRLEALEAQLVTAQAAAGSPACTLRMR